MPTFIHFMNNPMGENTMGSHKDPFLVKFMNGLTPTIVSQRMTLCSLPKTELVEYVILLIILMYLTNNDDYPLQF